MYEEEERRRHGTILDSCADVILGIERCVAPLALGIMVALSTHGAAVG
jgi:hypothetical protein